MTANTTQIHLTDQWREIAAVVDRYEDAVGEQFPDVTPFLEGVSAPNRTAALLELLQVEQEHRWKRREGKTVEDYLAAYPELLTYHDAKWQLARSECRLRCGAGDFDFRKNFSRRFPDLELECDTLGGAATTAAPTPAGRCKSCPRVRPRQIGRYWVEARIGGGAYGVVYRCRDAELDRLVAIKVARDASGGVEALLHEAQNVAGMAHPNIVGLLDYGKLDDGRPYIVYQYVAGRTLADRITARDYTLGEAIRWTIALAGALQAAHRRRIYHRDIKPANILVDEEGVVRLTDFGLARRDDLFYRDDRGEQLGTPAYMSPEQASSHSDWAGPASDIYSLGVVLYELLCFRVPFRDTDLKLLIVQIKERTPESPRSLYERIPAGVEEACLRALAKDPAKRFRTAGDFARALQTAIEPRSRRVWLVVAAAAALAILGLICFGRPGQKPSATPPPGPRLQLERPRIDVISDRGDEVTTKNLPHPGDNLQIFTRLSKNAYLYVIVFFRGQQPRVLKGTEAAECVVYESPHLTVPPHDGVMAVVIGARSEPLRAGALAAFTGERFDWPPPLSADRLNAFPASAVDVADISPDSMVRGGRITPFVFPAGFKSKLVDLFPETHYAVMIPYFDKSPGPASP